MGISIAIVLIIMLLLLLAGFPMIASFTFGALGMIFALNPNLNMMFLVQQDIAGVSTFTLVAIPMFILAADIMSYGMTANHLVDFIKAFCGHLYGGLAITVAGACTVFGAISGSGNATVVAIGKPLRSRMISSGYDAQNTDALICSSATIATLIPPSINMIMYCVLTNASVGEMFIAGIIPGIICFLFFSVYNYIYARKHDISRSERVDWPGRWKVFKKSILIVGGIYSGIFTPTEAAAASVIYAMICEMLIYRTVKIRDLFSITESSGIMTSAIFILIGLGQGFSWVLGYFDIPTAVTEIALKHISTPLGMAILISVAFWIACMLMDQIVAMILLVPLVFPMATAMGMDPIYVGVLVCLQSAIGFITPPFGSNIFVACAAFKRSYVDIIKGLPPYLIILLIISVIYIVFPDLALIYR